MTRSWGKLQYAAIVVAFFIALGLASFASTSSNSGAQTVSVGADVQVLDQSTASASGEEAPTAPTTGTSPALGAEVGDEVPQGQWLAFYDRKALDRGNVSGTMTIARDSGTTPPIDFAVDIQGAFSDGVAGMDYNYGDEEVQLHYRAADNAVRGTATAARQGLNRKRVDNGRVAVTNFAIYQSLYPTEWIRGNLESHQGSIVFEGFEDSATETISKWRVRYEVSSDEKWSEDGFELWMGEETGLLHRFVINLNPDVAGGQSYHSGSLDGVVTGDSATAPWFPTLESAADVDLDVVDREGNEVSDAHGKARSVAEIKAIARAAA